jgi:hypothetical protein
MRSNLRSSEHGGGEPIRNNTLRIHAVSDTPDTPSRRPEPLRTGPLTGEAPSIDGVQGYRMCQLQALNEQHALPTTDSRRQLQDRYEGCTTGTFLEPHGAGSRWNVAILPLMDAGLA